MKNLSCPMCKFPAEVEQGDALPSCLSSHAVNKCPFCRQFSTTFFAFLCFLLILLVQWPWSVVLNCCLVFLSRRRLWGALWRKYILNKLHSGKNYYSVLVVSSMPMNQQYILNNKSLNRTTYNIKLLICIDQLTKMLWPGDHRNLTLYFC